jgi:hypothetical protein
MRYRAAILLLGALGLAGCTSGGGNEGPTKPHPLTSPAAVGGLTVDGAAPTITWDPVSGATSYVLTVSAEDGQEPPWMWSGPATSAEYGTFELTTTGKFGFLAEVPGMPTGFGGARRGMTYRVSIEAFADDGTVVGLGDLQTFTCRKPCGGEPGS